MLLKNLSTHLTPPLSLTRRARLGAGVLITCLLTISCGGQQTLGSTSADAAPSTAAIEDQQQPPDESTAGTDQTSTTENPEVDDPDATGPDPQDSGADIVEGENLPTGIVGQNSIDEFESGLEFWASAVDVVLEDQVLLPTRKTRDIDDQSVTFYNVDPGLFVTATTTPDGVITGHTFAFDPSTASYLGFGSAYRLTTLPTELLFGPEMEQFIADPDRAELTKEFADGDVLITRTGVDPLEQPVFVMSIVPATDPPLSHTELRMLARRAGQGEGSDVTGEETAGSGRRDLTVTACEFVDGNARYVGEVTNRGDEEREYLVRLEIFDDDGERTIPIVFGGDLAPGESFDFDDVIDIGGGNWSLCQMILLDPLPFTS